MKHWVFDLDGTLVDSFSHYFDSLESIFRAHGVTFTQDLHHAALTEPIPQFLERQLGPSAVAVAVDMLKKKSNDDAAHVQPFAGIMPTMQHLADQGARIAVWTNRDLESAQLILAKTGLDRFSEICVSGTCVAPKPDPAGLLRIMSHFGCGPDSVTVIGDHANDMLAAKTAGASTVRASWHAYWEMEPCGQADLQFYSVAEFSTWVRSALIPADD